MNCTNCSNHSCRGRCSITRQIRVDTPDDGSGGGGPSTDDLGAVALRGNTSSVPLVAPDAVLDDQLATLKQVKEYVQGVSFEYIVPDSNGNLYV